MKISNALLLLPLLAGPVLAGGDVFVKIGPGGDLIITGDALGNDVDLDGQLGYPAVRGRNGTTINGSTEPFVIPNRWVDGRILIDLGDGSDSLVVTRLDTNNGTVIDLGRGADWLGLFDAIARGSLEVDLGRGDDFLVASDCSMRGDVTLFCGSGSDIMEWYVCQFRAITGFFGGIGFDELRSGACDFDLTPTIVGFEFGQPRPGATRP